MQTWQWLTTPLKFRASVIPIILPRVLIFTVFAFSISWLYKLNYLSDLNVLVNLTDNPVFDLVLGLLIVFQTNTAYNRFWEGRKLWGNLVVSIRILSREIHVGILESENSKQDKIRAIKLLSAFAIAVKLLLYKKPIDSSIKVLITEAEAHKLEQVANPPLEITLWIGEYLHQQYRCQRIDSMYLNLLISNLNSLVEGLTGCERINSTPIPFVYSNYLRCLILIYCLSLPIHLVQDLGLWTAIFVGLVSFVLLGVEEIANEIEMPFGTDSNDLPLDQICQTIVENSEALMAFTSDGMEANQI
jgi:putative membrane protein